MERLRVVKIGGAIIEDAKSLDDFLASFASIREPKVLVHGGGRSADVLLKQLGHEIVKVEGRRITDQATLDILIMVYAGQVNKTITTKLQELQCNAIGMTGADANIIRAVKRPVNTLDYGFVGDIEAIDGARINGIIHSGLVPVICALTHDGKGQLLNTNADTIAAELASAMTPYYGVSLEYCFEVEGVLEDMTNPASVIPHLTLRTYQELKTTGVVSGGMIPKLDTAFGALSRDVSEVRIGRPQMIKDNDYRYTKITLK